MNIFHTASETLSPTAAFTCLFINCNGGSDSVSVSLVARHSVHALAMNQLLHFPEELEKIINPGARSYDHWHEENKGMEPAAVDIKETPKEYVFYAVF